MNQGITRKERSLFDQAIAYFESTVPPGGVLRFRGKPVKDIVWTEREKIRVILEYQKETDGLVSRNGHVTIFPPPMTLNATLQKPK